MKARIDLTPQIVSRFMTSGLYQIELRVSQGFWFDNLDLAANIAQTYPANWPEDFCTAIFRRATHETPFLMAVRKVDASGVETSFRYARAVFPNLDHANVRKPATLVSIPNCYSN